MVIANTNEPKASGIKKYLMICSGEAPIAFAASIIPRLLPIMSFQQVLRCKVPHILSKARWQQVVPIEVPTTNFVNGTIAINKIINGSDLKILIKGFKT